MSLNDSDVRYAKSNYNIDNEDKDNTIISNIKNNLEKFNFINEAFNIVNDYFISEVNNVNTNCFFESIINPFNFEEINNRLNSKQVYNNKEYFNSCIDSIDKYCDGKIYKSNENIFKNLYGEISLDKLNEIYKYNGVMNEKNINLKNENKNNSNNNEKNQLKNQSSNTNQSKNKNNPNTSISSKNQNSLNNSDLNNNQNNINNTSSNNNQISPNQSKSNKNQISPNKRISNKNQISPKQSISNKNQNSTNQSFSNKNQSSSGNSLLNNNSQNQSISNSRKTKSEKNNFSKISEIDNDKIKFSTVKNYNNKIFKENLSRIEDSYNGQKKNDLLEGSTRTYSYRNNIGNKNYKNIINQKKQYSEHEKKQISRSNTKVNKKRSSNFTIQNDSKLNLTTTFNGSQTVYQKKKNFLRINVDNTANYSKIEKESQRKKLNKLLLDEDVNSKRKVNKSYDIVPPVFEVLNDIEIICVPKNINKLNQENKDTLDIFQNLEKENEEENENEDEKNNNNENNKIYKTSTRFSFKYFK